MAAAIRDGAGLLVVLGERSTWDDGGADLLPGTLGRSVDRAGTSGATLGYVDFSHAALEIFRSPRTGDLTAAHVYRYRTLSSPARTLARLDDGAVALAERKVGRGTVVAWTSTFDGYWNDLPLKPAFVPFLHQMVRHLGRYLEPKSSHAVGDVYDPREAPPASPGARLRSDATYAVWSPSGSPVPLDAAAGSSGVALVEPGFYEIRPSVGGVEPQVVAVNVPVGESDLAAVDPVELSARVTAVPAAGAAAAGADTTIDDPRAPSVAVVVSAGGRARHSDTRGLGGQSAAADCLMPNHDDLLRIIGDVRTRWRWKVVLRSVTVLVGAAILALLGAAYGLERFRFSPSAIIVFRSLMYAVLVVLGWLFFVRPLGRRVSDQQVALYLEEHEPSLQELLVSAVEAGAPSRPTEHTGESVVLLRQIVKAAVEQCDASDAGRSLERESLRRTLGALGVIVVVATLVFTFGPAYLRHGAFTVLVPAIGAEASPYRIDVTPGAATIARGADLSIAAKLHGFTAPQADLYTRATSSAPFERVSMVAPSGDAPFELTLFRVKESFEYFVQAAGVRSAVFRIEAAALPFVERMEMEFVLSDLHGVSASRRRPGRGHRRRARHHGSCPHPFDDEDIGRADRARRQGHGAVDAQR